MTKGRIQTTYARYGKAWWWSIVVLGTGIRVTCNIVYEAESQARAAAVECAKDQNIELESE